MTPDRIKEIQAETAYPESVSVQQALLKVWNETEQEQLRKTDVSGLLLRSKAKKYAKNKHQDEYNDPMFHRDVLETLNDFEAGYKAAMKDLNDR